MPVQLDEFLSKYKVHDETVKYLKQQTDNGLIGPDVCNVSVEEFRQQKSEAAAKFSGEVEFAGTVREFKVPASGVPDGIPIDVIKPKFVVSNPMILVYIHGGGFIVGSRAAEQSCCKILARDIPCIIVNVEYRLAPEHPFPAAQEDVKSVVRWVIMNKSLIGGSNDSKIGVLGVSAGGGLAANVCHEVKKSIDFLVLVYPWLDLRCGQDAFTEFSSGPMVSKDLLMWYTKHIITKPEDVEHPRASPLLHQNFKSHPPTLLLIAELDPLRDQAYEYKRKLKEAEIVAESLMIKGSVHGFFPNVDAFKELSLKARERLMLFIKKRVTKS